jgi:hypothetical protein
MQLSAKNDLRVPNGACSLPGPVDVPQKDAPKQASFNQSTLFSFSEFPRSDFRSNAKGNSRQVEPQSVTFVGDSFLSKASRKKKSGKKQKPKAKKVKDKRVKKSKYNFVKNLFTASKKKLTTAKKFIMKIGNIKTKEKKPQNKFPHKKQSSAKV